MRVRAGIQSLRHPRLFPAVRAGLAAATSRSTVALRIVHFSVQRDHVHLLVEAHDTNTLARGLRGLSIRLARAVNRALGRTGAVWGDRYHTRALASPREVRDGLVYVLMNFRKHLAQPPRGIDACSSAPWFDGFRADRRAATITPPPITPSPVARPRTWLVRVGWRRHGLIGVDECPRSPPARGRV